MSGGPRTASRPQSISSGSSIGPPEWTCPNCLVDGAAVELIESDGNMVCPQCALVDATASSARGHVDVNDVSGQIVEHSQTIQSLENTWNDRPNWHDRTFMVSPANLACVAKLTSRLMSTRFWPRSHPRSSATPASTSSMARDSGSPIFERQST